MDPLVAVTHPDPYPYYAGLSASPTLLHDPRLGVWIAASAEAVTAALTSTTCRVRPPDEPIPTPLRGTAAGALFGQLMRMNDGPTHDALKRAATDTLDAVVAAAATEARRWARALLATPDPRRLPAFARELSVHVLGSLAGIAPELLPAAVGWVDDYVTGIGPWPDVARAAAGAAKLLAAAQGPPAFTEAARDAGCPAGEIAANRAGFLTQAYEATAGLVGSTLVALARRPELRSAPVAALVREAARHDSPVQNSRRFVASDAIVAGQAVARGDTILVVLAAANRDPRVNPDPDRFDASRRDSRCFTFGVGPHACPGRELAEAIAAAGVARVLEVGVDLPPSVTYRRSHNTRLLESLSGATIGA